MRLPLLVSFSAIALFVAAACGGDGNEDEHVADIIQRMVVAARGSDTGSVDHFPAELPEGLPAEPPIYPAAELIGSTRVLAPPLVADEEDGADADPSAQTALYFIVLDTGDDRSRVSDFYQEELDSDPWQLDASASTQQLDRLDFSNVRDADIAGIVQIVPADDGSGATMFISVQDAGAQVEGEPAFEPGIALTVPRSFPEEMPQYPDAIVTNTAFQRSEDSENFLLISITTDSPTAVVTFYRDELSKLGWAVEEREAAATEVRLHFEDDAGQVEGDLVVDQLPEDAVYTEVDLRLQVRLPQEPAEAPTATPEPTAGVE